MRGRGPGVPWPATPEQGARWTVGAVVAGAFVLGALEGGYAASRWAPFALVVLWATVAVLARTGRGGPDRARTVAVAASALLVAWTAASVAWASTPATALDAAGRTALYGIVLTLALRPRWPAASVRRLLVVVAAGGVLLAGFALLRVVLADDPGRWFVDGRMTAPLGYVNATGAMWAVVLPALVHVAAGGVRSPAGRALALGGAGLVLQTSLLSQSRGALVALTLALVVQVALTPDRLATLAVVAATAAGSALVAGTLLDVRGAVGIPDLAERVDGAGLRIAAASIGLLLLGAAGQLLLAIQRPLRRAALSDRRRGRLAAWLAAAACVVAFAAGTGDPVGWASDRADQVLHGSSTTVPVSGSRLTGDLGSERGDMYRVALDMAAARPLQGFGAEDFRGTYLRERRTDETPRYAHSLPLGVLSGLGIVGLLLLAAALGAPFVAALRRRSRLDDPARAGSAAAIAGVVAWAAECTWDWTWEFPALTVLAMVLLGVAARATVFDGGPVPGGGAERPTAFVGGPVPSDVAAPGPRPWAAAAVLAAALAGSVVLAALGGASYHLRSAESATDAGSAARSLDRAARLDPLDGDAVRRRAVLARRLGDDAAWRSGLRDALDRAPDDWVTHLELGMAEAEAGDRPAAVRSVRRAAALNPRQATVGAVLRTLGRGGAVDPDAVEAAIAASSARRLAPTRP